MNKLADIIVRRRKIILLLVLLLTAACGLLIPQVKVNSDMTEYLPDDSNMRKGLELLSEQLPGTNDSHYIRVMLRGLDEDERLAAKDAFSAIDYVDGVEYEPAGEEYNSGEYSLFKLATGCEYDSPEENSIENAVAQLYPGENTVIENGSTFYEIPTWVLALALTSLLLILFAMSESWFEPLLFVATIGAAVILNMGTNILRGSVSNTTAAISAILQLVLSMDYSIIIMSRYRQELQTTSDHAEAMKSALKNSFSSVTSSALTTFVGLLMLVFMSFKIGPDLGIALAKGVVFSLLCVFLMLPALILMFDKTILKTQKKVLTVPTKKLAAFSYKARKPMLAVCVLLMAAAAFLQSKTEFSFDLTNESRINDIFPEENSVIVLYRNFDDRRIQSICDEFENDPGIKQIAAYPTTIAKEYTYEELGDALSSMGDELSLEPELLRLVYAMRFENKASHMPNLEQLISFAAQQPAFSDYADDASSLLQLARDAGMDIQAELSSDMMYRLISSANLELDRSSFELLYLAYQSENNFDPAWTMSIEGFVSYLNDEVMGNADLSALIDEESRALLADAQSALDEAQSQLRGEKYSILAFTTELPRESDETTAFTDKLSRVCEEELKGDHYIIGTSAMYHELRQDFRGEILLLTVLTAVSIFIIVLVTFRNVLIPTVLVLLVQCAVFITAAFSYVRGYAMNYMAYLIVQCILMGATIDYGILFVNYYRENRATHSVSESLIRAYDGAIHTILTSGLIVILVTGLLGITVSAPAIGPICSTISLGALSAVLLILFVLPAVIAALDKHVVSKKAYC